MIDTGFYVDLESRLGGTLLEADCLPSKNPPDNVVILEITDEDSRAMKVVLDRGQVATLAAFFSRAMKELELWENKED